SDGKAELMIAHVNPFKNAFVARNPLVPQQKTADPNMNRLIKKLNADDDLSVLKCKKPYSLAVAAFQGASYFQSQGQSSSCLEKLFGRGGGESLAASGQNAHNFAEALRKMGFDAYVLHLQGGSLVTIGGFDRKDDPGMQQIQQALTRSIQADR